MVFSHGRASLFIYPRSPAALAGPSLSLTHTHTAGFIYVFNYFCLFYLRTVVAGLSEAICCPVLLKYLHAYRRGRLTSGRCWVFLPGIFICLPRPLSRAELLLVGSLSLFLCACKILSAQGRDGSARQRCLQHVHRLCFKQNSQANSNLSL